ncbi:hypothetical protein KFK09_003468 [Dendrobium nobile]|uniref:Uncharacterized protein n=1 Tax=Dendrobium nobile TaxID=94219 RepID=A0A8T3C0B8_DENNO|nr:hypothetical protein KFK09_003468 [Dendrobium nobile]
MRLGFAFHLLFSSLLFGSVAFAGGVEIAGVASPALSWLFDFAPATTSTLIGSYGILIGSKNESSLVVKIYNICLRQLILKVQIRIQKKRSVNPVLAD